LIFELGVGNMLISKNVAVCECLVETLNQSSYLACELNFPRMMPKKLSIDAKINLAGKDQQVFSSDGNSLVLSCSAVLLIL